MKKDIQPKKETKLTVDELKIINQILYNSKWNGQEWNQVVIPLLNKITIMIN